MITKQQIQNLAISKQTTLGVQSKLEIFDIHMVEELLGMKTWPPIVLNVMYGV